MDKFYEDGLKWAHQQLTSTLARMGPGRDAFFSGRAEVYVGRGWTARVDKFNNSIEMSYSAARAAQDGPNDNAPKRW